MIIISLVFFFVFRFTSFNEMLSLAYVSLGFFAAVVSLSISFGRSVYRSRALYCWLPLHERSCPLLLLKKFRFTFCFASFVFQAVHVHRVDLSICFCSPTDFAGCLVSTDFKLTHTHRTKESEKAIKRELGIYV